MQEKLQSGDVSCCPKVLWRCNRKSGADTGFMFSLFRVSTTVAGRSNANPIRYYFIYA